MPPRRSSNLLFYSVICFLTCETPPSQDNSHQARPDRPRFGSRKPQMDLPIAWTAQKQLLRLGVGASRSPCTISPGGISTSCPQAPLKRRPPCYTCMGAGGLSTGGTGIGFGGSATGG